MGNNTSGNQARIESLAAPLGHLEEFMPPEQNTERLACRATPTLKEACEVAAERDGFTLSDWMRFVLARAAYEGAFSPPKKRVR